MRNVCAAILLTLILSACSTSSPSPFDGIVPPCTDAGEELKEVSQSWKEHGESVIGPERWDYRRLCEAGNFKLWMRGSEFQSSHVASEYLNDFRVTMYDSPDRMVPAISWHPDIAVDEYAIYEHRTGIDFVTGEPTVGYGVMTRVGQVIFFSGSQDNDAFIFRGKAHHPPYLTGQVIGDARWDEVEKIMDTMLARWAQR